MGFERARRKGQTKLVQRVVDAAKSCKQFRVPWFLSPTWDGIRYVSQDLVEHRKNSWELYGYDFMLDDQYKPWLIEINSSPACDYSTKVGIRIRPTF